MVGRPGTELVRVCQKIGQCNEPVKKPEQSMTWVRPNFFFQTWDLKPISIYTLCSQEKIMFF